MRTGLIPISLSLALAALACGSNPAPPADVPDAGSDAGTDAGDDGGPDGGGPDSGSDAGNPDSGSDAGYDAGPVASGLYFETVHPLLPTDAGVPPDGAIFRGDFDEDGIPDVLFAYLDDFHRTIVLAKGAHSFPWTQSSTILDADNANGEQVDGQTIQVADVDGDGHLDLLITVDRAPSNALNPDHNTYILLKGDGHGGFTQEAELPVPAGGYATQLIDVDGDGLLDYAGCSTTSAVWAKNDGGGTFGAATTATFPALNIDNGTCQLADIDGDGKVDALVTDTYFTEAVYILWNTSQWTFPAASPVDYSTTNTCLDYSEYTDFRDIDGDGRTDLVEECQDRIIVHFQTAQRTFTVKQVNTFDYYYPGELLFEDMNGDGVPDLLAFPANGNPLHVFFWNKTARTFDETSIYDTPESGGVVYDWTQDGNKDLVMGGGVWALGKSGGQLALPPLFNLAPGSGEPVDFNQAAWLDVDGDGAADLVTTSATGAPTAFGLKSGPNGKVLTFPFSYPAQISGAGIGIEAVDLNGDGYPDLIVTAAGATTDTYLSAGSASGVKAPVALQWPAGAYASAVGQFGGDSTLDFMVLGYTQGSGAALQFYILNSELGVTATQTSTLAAVSAFPNYVYAVDFDGDGLSDLILGYVNPISAELWKNQGGYAFSKVMTLSPQTQAYGGEWDYFTLFAGNFYGDGRQDLWFTELPNGAASLYENLGGGALGPVSDALSLQSPDAVDLKGSGVLDMVDTNAIYMGPFTPGPRVTLDVAVSIAGPLANFDNSGVLAYPVLHSIQDYRGYAGFLRPGPTPLP